MAYTSETDTALEDETTEAERDSERLKAVYERAIRRFDDIASATMQNREESLVARRFITIPGAQWEGEWGRQFDNSIKLEVDKVGRGVQKIERDYRENRIVPDFRPDGPLADPKTADMLDGLHRADSYRFKSQQARDNAAFEAIAGGFGAYRLTNELEDPRDKNNDYQRINPAAIITDADQTVFFDLSAKLYDKSDAQFAYIRTSYTPEAWEERFGEGTATDFPDGVRIICRDWFKPQTYTAAEYYEREDVDETLWILTHELSGEEQRIWASDLPKGDGLKEYKADGWKAKAQRRKRCRVHKYIISGAEVLEDNGYIAGECIPIVPVYGRRYFVDGIERWKGYVQDKMDAQRLYNSNVSKLAETNALAPREVPIFDPEQIDGEIANQWANATIDRLPYLLAHSLRDASGNVIASGPIGKITPPQLAPVTATLLQIAAGDLTEDLQDADEVKANTSAEAMDIAASRVDAKSGIYLDNIAQSTQREGEVYLSMASEVYVEDGREIDTMNEDGTDQRVKFMASWTDPKTGENRTINDLSSGRYKVIVSVTEATATRRDKTVKAMLNIAQVAQTAGDEDLAQAAVLTAVMNIDGEGSDNMIEFARKKAVAMGLEQPTEEEQQAMAEAEEGQAPDPLAEVAQAQAADLMASAEKKRAETMGEFADIQNTQADTEQKRAKTAQIVAETGQDIVETPMLDAMPGRLQPRSIPVTPPRRALP